MAQYNLGRIVGPALAGAVLVLGSFTWAFALNALSYGAVLAALLLVRVEAPPPSDEPTGLRARMVAGVRGARAEPGCRTAILTIAVTALLLSPFIALIPAVTVKLFDGGEGATSLLIGAQGVGAVAGALSLASLAHRYGRRQVLVASLLVLPFLLAAYSAAPTLAAATVVLVAVGAAYVNVLSGLGTVVQLRAPDALRARILSLYMVALGVVYPLGAVLQGALGDRFGMRAVTAGGAAIFLVVLVVAGVSRPDLVASLDDASSGGALTRPDVPERHQQVIL